jgi:hypothetical protein
MKRLIAACVTVGLAIPIGIGVTATFGAAADTDCWDEYNLSGSRFYGTLTPKDLPIEDCTPADRCLTGYNRSGTENRLFVPKGANPRTACAELDVTTTTTTTTTSSPGTTPAPTGTHFATLPPGSTLPTDAQCASRVRPMSENRPGNATANAVRGTKADATYPRVTGDYSGTTDEIIQWTACKWGIDEDLVRAQIVVESNWSQTALGDFTTDSRMCAPGFPIGNYPAQYNGDSNHNGQCPESVGLGQVRWFYHQSAFADGNASKSSAYNLDYTYAVWRACFDGELGWLNTVDRGADYAAGDATGCQGVWFSGRWYTQAAKDYIARVQDHLAQRTWEQTWFGPAYSSGTIIATGTSTTTVAPATTAPSTTTTAPSTTTTAPSTTTTAPSTTVVPTTTAVPSTTTTTTTPAVTPTSATFVETFDNNAGLDRLVWGVYHRDQGHRFMSDPEPFLGIDNNAYVGGSWTGDHDESCGGPDTQRKLSMTFQQGGGDTGWLPRMDWNVSQLLYVCRNHMMSTMGPVAAYSVLWFGPDVVFDDVNEVSWDVNMTYLGPRQWFKVGVVSEKLYQSTQRAGWQGIPVPGHVLSDVGASGLDGNMSGPDRLLVTYGGAASAGDFGGVMIGNNKVGNAGTSGTDKATRFPMSVRDNGNGTVTFTIAGQTYTGSGSFPACPCRVVFYDQNYTPDKDGEPVGHTFHWDNIMVR